MTGADKRLSPRFSVELAVEIETDGGRVLAGQSRNLSQGGLCLETADPVPAGADVTVRVTLLFDENRSSEPLELPARVVWCTPFGDAHQIGTRFGPLSSERMTYLDMFLRYLAQQAASHDDEADGEDEDEDDPFAA